MTPREDKTSATPEDKTNAALDAALEMTFPASDPIAVYLPEANAAADTGASPANLAHASRPGRS